MTEDEDQDHLEIDDSKVQKQVHDLLVQMSSDPEASMNLDAILSILFDQGIVFDAKQLSLLIAKFLMNIKTKSGTAGKVTKSEISAILEQLQVASNFLLMQYALSVQSKQIGSAKEESPVMNEKQKNVIKEVVKKAMIYEAYKVISPRQIAGETADSNFHSNIILRGLKTALKLESKTQVEAEKSYGKGFIQNAIQDGKKIKSKSGQSR